MDPVATTSDVPGAAPADFSRRDRHDDEHDAAAGSRTLRRAAQDGSPFRALAHPQTFVAGLRCDGLVAPWVLDGPMNGEAFETYIETQLAPILARGDVVIMDNLSSHKSERVERLIRERGAWPLFLPPYSPDLNPIEMAFAKLKQLLRKLNPRTIDQLWRAIGSVCSAFTPDECWNFFRHCGYAPASS